MTREKSTKLLGPEEREAARWLLKPLRLEAETQYQDRAVAGGLERWLPGVKVKLVAQVKLTLDQAAHLLEPLVDYSQATATERARKLEAVWERLEPAPQPVHPSVPKAKLNTRSVPPMELSVSGHVKTGAEPLPPLGTNDLDQPVQYLKGVGPQRARLLRRLNIETTADLLRHFPREWEDRRQLRALREVKAGEAVTVLGQVRSKSTFSLRRGLTLTKVVIADAGGQLELAWFNQPFQRDRFEVGQRVIAHGKVEFFRTFQMRNPEIEWLEDEQEDTIHTGRIVPVYPLTEQLSQRVLRTLLYSLTVRLPEVLPEVLPPEVLAERHFPSARQAIQDIHFPQTFEALDASRARLIFEELFLQQIAALRLRRHYQQEPATPLTTDGALVTAFHASLPFTLTAAQARAQAEIFADLGRSQAMHRLLQGDVGSGKTVVAAAAMLAAVDNGKQAAIMAPTEVLAVQHATTLGRMLAPLGVRLELFTSQLTGRERQAAHQRLAEGQVQVAVGTHALTQSDLQFQDLAVAVVDEQHRFGVEQRGRLRAKGQQPHVLVMTATPIPRTLAMTAYGDLAVSTIDELPPGRRPVVTHWLKPKENRKAFEAVAEAVREGHQAYIVFPLIEESEKLELKALTTEYHRLQTLFPGIPIGLLHGRLPDDEKNRVMEDFKQGGLPILASTTVIEVGVDVPNAVVMVIENAERFGLSQLHQLRGRVGRSALPASCYLLSEAGSDEARQRMEIICRVQNGFILAEEDLRMRGPGEFFGLKQHGLPDLKVADLLRDVAQIEPARQSAARILKDDPSLENEKHAELKRVYLSLYGGREDRMLAG